MSESEENMLEMCPHNHFEESHFASSFTVLAQLRHEDVLTDISLVAENNIFEPAKNGQNGQNGQKVVVRAHKIVLMAVSDYFRTMFKTCFVESDLDNLQMPGEEVYFQAKKCHEL